MACAKKSVTANTQCKAGENEVMIPRLDVEAGLRKGKRKGEKKRKSIHFFVIFFSLVSLVNLIKRKNNTI